MKPRDRDLLRALQQALRNAPPKSRDRIRRRLHAFERAMEIKRELRKAA